MPELPEVETTMRGLSPHVVGQEVTSVVLRRPDLRFPIAPEISSLSGSVIRGLSRRAKYLLMHFDHGSAVWHLGMSGSMRVFPVATPLRPHDHVDLVLSSDRVLRFNDPRRFGSLLWTPPDVEHPLLAGLGPEPLSPSFTGSYLWKLSRGRRVRVKPFLMQQDVVVGVGNIYVTEALFLAGISPRRAAGSVSLAAYERIVAAIQSVLSSAIEVGGTSLKDFITPDGARGYFTQSLQVYGRGGEPCVRCGTRLRSAVLGQRASVWCPSCQK